MRKGCTHGQLYRTVNPRGGWFCSKCWNESRNTGKKALHDKSRNPREACVEHGPHFVVQSWQGREFCLACGPADQKKVSSWADRKCKVCEKEEKKQREMDEIEKITRPTYQEMAGKLDEIENFTRIKNAT